MEGGNLTVADLARWMGRPDPTVRGWVERGISPSGPARDVAEVKAALARLETKVRAKAGFPVPRLSWNKRREYVEKIRAEK